ncbi:PilX N-terminal domain-containing pilus assembly protein [Halomonas sp. RA08-2]|uniref:PilX N-terminal domain-containing pilus assembly protein n=1 Tax=Halomonas sp. RA08-2 TaxID=3440842 RepID=UPI003EEC8C0C
MNKRYSGSSNQSGAALIVTLVLLVVGLLLGLSSFQNSQQEESMAGNHRASALAMMAAEYGASQFWHDVQNAIDGGDIASPGDPGADDDYDTYLIKILESFTDWAENSTYNPTYGKCENLGGEIGNACYRISVGAVSGRLVSIASDGFVHEGEIVDTSNNGIPENQISRRRIAMGWGAMLGESLSPFNLAGDIVDYDGIKSQAEVSGEEIDGYVNPAISVAGKDQAEKIVQDIVGEKTDIDNKAVFIPKNPNDCKLGGSTFHQSCGPKVEGVYHAKDNAVITGDPPEYTGKYEGCKSAQNDLCNYKGGISSKLGANILSRPDEFHDFINALVQQEGENPTVWKDQIDTNHGDGVTFVTAKTKPDSYEKLPDSGYLDYKQVYEIPIYGLDDNVTEDGRLTKSKFEVAKNGGFAGSGVLVVDGDLEFKGNPGFDGLIIVLGDYNLSGGGKEDFTGAIISAPYSKRYEYQKVGENSEWEYLRSTPAANSDGDIIYIFTDENGNEVYLDGNAWTLDPGEDGVEHPRLTSNHFEDSELNLNKLSVSRKFDPVGLNVNGGGTQNHVYSYDSIEKAFSYLDDQSLLALLVGQAKPDGSYDYGLSVWEENVSGIYND